MSINQALDTVNVAMGLIMLAAYLRFEWLGRRPRQLTHTTDYRRRRLASMRIKATMIVILIVAFPLYSLLSSDTLHKVVITIASLPAMLRGLVEWRKAEARHGGRAHGENLQ